jgi:hypothetical protein
MVSDAGERRPMGAFLYVYVDDTDAVHRRAVDAGARSLEAPAEMPYGDRRCMVEDRWGKHLADRDATPRDSEEARLMSPFSALDADAAREFAQRWLPAWTGNDPERLVAFYSDDVFYSDPAVPRGVRGRDALLAYLRKLLARNPDWVWTHRGSIPLADGFLNEWHASMPVGSERIEVDGVCTVHLRAGLIYRNMVYFDRSELLAAWARQR